MRENKLLMLIASAIIVATALFASSSAMAQNSGTCGDNATWTYDENTKTLTISGTGAMSDYYTPWSSIQDIQTIVVEEGITTIGEYAFSNCKKLTSVTIPSSVKTIGSGAFNDCVYLASVTLSEGIETIGEYAFVTCIRLTSITIPKSVKKIEESAFSCCLSLYLTVPETVETIGNNAFMCVNNIVYNGDLDGAPWGAYAINGYFDGDYIYSDQAKTELLRYIGNDTEVKIPDGVTTIGPYAFHYYAGNNFKYADVHNRITKVDIPNSVTTIGKYAFADNNITSVTIPENVTTIEHAIFHRNFSFECIYFKNDPEKLKMNGLVYVQSDQSDVKCFVSPETLDIWTENFWNLDHLFFCVEGEEYEKDGVVYILGTDGSAMVLKHTDALPTEVVIPPTITKDNIVYPVTTIGANAFSKCGALTSVTIPNGVTTIGRNAFSNCKNLTSFNIPDSIKKIGTEAFYRCNNLEGDLILPEGVTTIGEKAFIFCNKITALSIPESVTSIGKDAFDYVMVTDVWWHASLDKFGYILDYDVQQIHVPAETLDKFNEKYGNKYTFVGDIINIADNGITIEPQTYTGSALTPVVKDGDKTLVEGEDYTITLPQGGCTNAGEYTVTLQGKKLYYKKAEKSFTIIQATPTYTIPENLSLKCNQTLADITLPKGFAFDDIKAALTLGKTNTVTATFTPEDTKNYVVVKGIEIKVAVADHVHAEAVKENEVAATTENAGKYDEIVYCSVCGKELSRTPKTTPPLTHDNPNNQDNPSTPVSSISDNPVVKVWSFNHTIYIETLPDTEYKIIDLNGRVITTSKTKSTNEQIKINKSGILIVIIDNQSFKLSL